MKDRIRQVMESQRMTQQEFAQLIELVKLLKKILVMNCTSTMYNF